MVFPGSVFPGTSSAVDPVVRPLPALGLPPEALRSLRSAFSREVSVRLPRLLAVLHEADGAGPLGLAHSDAMMLAEGCGLLGDAAGARSLVRLAELLDVDADRAERLQAAETAALLLGRWADRPLD